MTIKMKVLIGKNNQLEKLVNDFMHKENIQKDELIEISFFKIANTDSVRIIYDKK